MASEKNIIAEHKSSQVTLVGLVVCILVIAFWSVGLTLTRIWSSQPDMSHGFFVPIVSLWLLWFRSDLIPEKGEIGGVGSVFAGVVIILLGIAIRCFGILYHSLTFETWSVLPVVLGTVIGIGGWKGLRWAWPSVVFLAFMLPLPAAVGGMFGAKLQSLSTVVSNFTLQLVGIPAVAEGNVIWLSSQPLGVAEACNGLRMLTAFFAISVATCFILDRPVWQKVVLLASAPFVGVVANVFRITLIGIIYEQEPGEAMSKFAHDFAGWTMMPFAIVILVIELWVLSGLILPDDSTLPYHDDAPV
ncbi:exosortase/archaeosortase family protein [Bremerella cremea]|uniref:Exosortase n=1 Tax=Blastopirellula marina TaxID=124 RepID=A0A2S8FLR0_9BACT|nr:MULTISPECIES: exosortase/archaeosortase family protein [Pirellulaceae]PQO32834.1 hypothetical protein C5Y83_21875 [Blastopirellula marina]RCS45901.1 exosortase/archaeosortase family protein [Bremerella cremea]